MDSFLDKLVDDLLNKHGADLSGLCLVFPTRRAGLYFKKRYSARLTVPAWSPVVFSIEDFVDNLSKYRTGDELDLIFELYRVYGKYFPEETFDKFYPWGVMLMKDFNEVDSALANGKQLFSSITDLKEIDEQFELAEEDLARIREFWKIYFDKEPGAIRKAFHDNWRHLESIYEEFTSLIKEKNMVYEGLAVRSVAEGLTDGSIRSDFRYHVFAGFYSLSNAEEKIIRHFINNKTAAIYFDTDNYYTDDLRQEAGTFIRKNSLISGEYLWKENLLEKDEKTIEMIGVPLQVLQAKTAGQIISGLPHDPQVMNRTAVVLPDEQLLMPVLYALPAHIEDVNVTMGYPLSASPLFNLTESLFELQKSFSQKSFYFKHVVSLLSHPYIQFSDHEGINRWLDNFKSNPEIRIQQHELTEGKISPVMKVLFGGFKSLPEALQYFNGFFSMLIEAVRNNKDGIQSIEKEYIYYFYTRFKKLEEILIKYPEEISVETFRGLFNEVIRSTRIPFTGEPLKGLQVMGFLETRVLDFDNLIILSLNEDVLPPASHHPSFIPYNLRRAFGLPTFEAHNAIAAYHFYRLLQRAKNIYLIYNTEVKNFAGGEKSRFLLQIENELLLRNPNLKLIQRKVTLQVNEAIVPAVDVKKTAEVMKELFRYYEPLTTPYKFARKFSASALGTYIACSLRFYFQYVAKLREPDEQDEFIEGGVLGTILHEAMHSLYKPLKTITKSDFEKIMDLAARAVDEAIKQEFGEVEALEGKNILMRNVLIELIRKILEFDKKEILTIKYLEEEFILPVEVENGKHVNLYGIIDRVDSSEGVLRVVDYKTGAPDHRRATDIESLFTSPDFKEQFQTFFYSMLLKKRERNMPVKAGLFRLRKLSEGIGYINDGNVISDEQFTEFFTRTKDLLAEIFNPEVPFKQTEDESRCVYCAYKDICNR
ncbi:MAG: PD-(D/E)XK nuclease family protein [Bacteroidetes bacterium]|nr:PD-(D/E)XK nuclease family protein [Bacteroidota bacterium]